MRQTGNEKNDKIGKIQTSKWKVDDAIAKYNRILGEKNKHLSLTKKKV